MQVKFSTFQQARCLQQDTQRSPVKGQQCAAVSTLPVGCCRPCILLTATCDTHLLVDERLRRAVRRVAAARSVRRGDVRLQAAVTGRRVRVLTLLRLVAEVLRIKRVALGKQWPPWSRTTRMRLRFTMLVGVRSGILLAALW